MITLKVLTYNIRHARGMDDRVDISRIANVLAASEADIICLQEVDRGLPRSGMVHQAEALASALDLSFTYFTNFGVPIAGMGNAILSRYPIYSTWNKLLPFSGEPRGLLQATISHPATPIDVYCTHWGLDEHQRGKQAQETARIVRRIRRNYDEPLIICGDLNALPHSQEVIELKAQADLNDAAPEDAMTYATDDLKAKIDYILVNAYVKKIDSHVITTDASDHLPILASLEIIPGTAFD